MPTIDTPDDAEAETLRTPWNEFGNDEKPTTWLRNVTIWPCAGMETDPAKLVVPSTPVNSRLKLIADEEGFTAANAVCREPGC